MPQRTIELLDALEAQGFTDSDFQRLHPYEKYNERGDKASIKAHRDYCSRLRNGFRGEMNANVQRRLEMVFGAYKGGRLTNPACFRHLVEAACCELPP